MLFGMTNIYTPCPLVDIKKTTNLNITSLKTFSYIYFIYILWTKTVQFCHFL